ncbi:MULTISPECIES: N-acetylmuramoyl-L-alanine amidase family protein [Butyricimonas]|uniref:N-acetylmuramoyl-L-alanine amidase family protein n=1 Tax=Butyricimonas TaxID=574697 RepID=UPI001D069C87|nr:MULTISPECIES: N-acetylmuramoyl-L-alanine amidase [Butyricimonas]MCB6973209.1 N-acetylmuramoyl-L-alanine amidase [Butyricimonas synergistica]MCG4519873.1 N-acetylmuramoyl-L-alanine amidase [Butyricimonas sp. DFI.6.44]
MINQCRFVGFLLVIFLLGGIKTLDAQDNLGRITCICIDAGHGGKDPGAISGRLREKDITLAVALKLGKMIKDAYPNIKIVYTRTKDVAVDLRERGRIANKAKAQLFISIHVNKFSKSTVRGVETYVLGLHKSEASFQVAMKENEAIHYEEDYSVKYDGFDPKKAESYIMFNFLKNSHLKNSMEFAAPVQNELVKRTKMPDREVRQAGFIVLMDVGMPAVLIETGFISNPHDQKILTSESGQTNLARAIFSGFQSYKNNVERNSVVIKVENPVTQSEEKKVTGTEKKKTENVVAPQNKNDLFYAVQVASSKTRIKDFEYLKLKEKIEELKGEERYRYYVGKTSTYEKALENQKSTRKVVKDCFIIAIYKGKQITVADARKIEQKK